MTYWMDLFTKTTWEEFRTAGSKVSGFNPVKAKYLEIVKPGDIFLCYMTGGLFRWVGALEVLGPSQDKRRIWKEAEYPVRFDVKPIVELDAETGLPMKALEGKVEFYRGPEDAGKYRSIIRSSLRPISSADGSLILSLLKSLPQA
jgi:hypothetical protein